ncbi:hypothetical protein CF319_g6487 [Tilletia indica]|nr:hypothetical protein CF319_g6487 [Tilletia indica]
MPPTPEDGREPGPSITYIPSPATIPAELQRHLNGIQANHSTFATLSNSLTVLKSIEESYGQLKARRLAELEHDLRRFEQKTNEEQSRLEEQVKTLLSEVERMRTASTQGMSSLIKTILTRDETEVETILGRLKICTVRLTEEVRQAEADAIKRETQLVGLHAWSVAWPIALRTLQEEHHSRYGGGTPPRYEGQERSGPALQRS